MKYICYFEFDEESLDDVIPKFQEMIKLRESGEYPTGTTPTYWVPGDMHGLTIYEVDDPQQITNHYLHYFPTMKLTWKPLIEASDFVRSYLEKKG